MTKDETVSLPDEQRQKCEVWTRVMGYFRPVDAFNIGKKAEYAERKCFSENVVLENIDSVSVKNRQKVK